MCSLLYLISAFYIGLGEGLGVPYLKKTSTGKSNYALISGRAVLIPVVSPFYIYEVVLGETAGLKEFNLNKLELDPVVLCQVS